MFLYVNNAVWWPRVHAYIDTVDFVCFSKNHRPYCEWQASVSAHDEIKIISLFVCCCCSCCCWWFVFFSVGLRNGRIVRRKRALLCHGMFYIYSNLWSRKWQTENGNALRKRAIVHTFCCVCVREAGHENSHNESNWNRRWLENYLYFAYTLLDGRVRTIVNWLLLEWLDLDLCVFFF